MIHKINAAHPSAIGLDIIFPEKDRLSPNQITSFYKRFFKLESSLQGIPKSLLDNDIIFSSALSRSHTVLGIYLDKNNASKNNCAPIKNLELNLDAFELESFDTLLCNTSNLTSSAQYAGFVNTYIDEDAVLRRMPLLRKYKDINVPTLSLATLLSISPQMKVLDGTSFEVLNHKIKTDKKTNILLHFYDDNWYKKVSIIDLLNNRVPKEMLTGKIVLLGSSATSLHDQIIVTGGKKIIGVKVHVTMLDNILNDNYLTQPEFYKKINILLSLLLSFILFYLLIKKYKYLILILFFMTSISIALSTFLAYTNGVYISIAYMLVPFLVHFFLITIVHTIIDTYDKHLFKEELTRLHIADLDKKVKERTAELVESHKHIQDNINYASLIQAAILPDESILQKYTKDYFIFWKPRDIVGGDIYFITELGSKEEILIMVLDGAGHGVSGAFVTMLVKAIETQIVAEIANKNMPSDPALILEFFNRSIKTMLKQEAGSKSNAGFDGGVLYYNKKTNICKYAGAKTSLYIINSQQIETIKSDRKNVGYVRTKIDQKYTSYNVEIHEGTQLYITTDGYPDQEGESHTRLSKERFLNLIQTIKLQPMDKQKEDIIKMFKEFKDTYEQSDDVTVLGLKF